MENIELSVPSMLGVKVLINMYNVLDFRWHSNRWRFKRRNRLLKLLANTFQYCKKTQTALCEKTGASDRNENNVVELVEGSSSRHGDGRHGKDVRAREERKHKVGERIRDYYSKDRFKDSFQVVYNPERTHNRGESGIFWVSARISLPSLMGCEVFTIING